jgi:PAS domain S-box-containing protein
MDAIISVNDLQRIILFNPAAEIMFGFSSHQAIGPPLEILIPPRFRRAHEEHLRQFIKMGATARRLGALGQLSGLRANGEEFPIEASVSMMTYAQNRIFTVILRDMTERKRAEEATARLAAIVTSSTDAIVGKTLDGTITSWNGGAARLFGYSEEEMIGQSIHRIIPADREEEKDCAARILAGEAVEDSETVRLHKDGRQIEVSIIISPVRNAAGKITGASKIVRDITAQKKANERLRESEERLRLSNEAAGIGTFTVDLEKDCAFYSPEAAAMFGIPGVQTATVEAAFSRVHRDDLAWVRKQYEAAASGTNTGQVKMDFRFVRPGGEVRWLTWIARADCREDQSGRRPFRILGACLDITERKLHEDRINLLMHEVNHRSKNILAIVQSVARQTIATDTDHFIEHFGKRIQALAASQGLLVSREWKGVGLDELIRAQLAHFSDLIGNRIDLGGPPLLISASAAQTIGMVLHELATNAGKYGSLSNDGGCVEVAWAIERSEPGEPIFAMSWRERGGPAVTVPSKRGFGSTVISRMVMENLDAQVEVEFLVTGLCWRLHCPAVEIMGGKPLPLSPHVPCSKRWSR